jgi:hypothetical protein
MRFGVSGTGGPVGLHAETFKFQFLTHRRAMTRYATTRPSNAKDGKHKLLVRVTDLKTGRQRTVRFGQLGASDFTMHKDTKRRDLYLQRHRKRENWQDPMTAGFWSARMLWGKTPVKEKALAAIIRQFKMQLVTTPSRPDPRRLPPRQRTSFGTRPTTKRPKTPARGTRRR